MAEKRLASSSRVTFHNPENGFVVLACIGCHGRGQVTAGWLDAQRLGLARLSEAEGALVQRPRARNLQFKAELNRTSPPHSREGHHSLSGVGL